ncbi:MAG: hypothetical protein CMM10_10660 [Rhodospirillaceae bacterium]|jgi:peptide/nickel transport system substrate-binding protein|nr:hypothetical protein [Rhodospirillaceae bacterium]MDP6644888.1 ABC transporter substrate-binding protein [Rhodospirillales bacterium]|tara:strand:- start:8072 stop:9601 length:1530 start_codon:yes stop_codon:yes gene_type:complete
MKIIKSTITATVALALAGPALAQKSKDTLRIAFGDPVSMVDINYDPKPESAFTARIVYDGLVHFDDFNAKFRPLLAKSWRRIDPLTLEFDLREDVKFHDGSPFDADDVVYTINWVTDPKTKLRFKSNWRWVAGVEKLAKYKVRVKAKFPAAMGLMRLAKSTPIYPSDSHGALKRKINFGKKPIGTGPWRVTQVEPNRGVVLVANPIKHGGDYKNVTNIGKVHAIPIPDRQTQIAHLLTGGVDMVRGLHRDQFDNLKKNPVFDVTATTGLLYTYISMDAAGRSGKKQLSDIRVRRAILHAIDRNKIQRHVVAGGAGAKPIEALCFRIQQGCDYNPVAVAYDPAKAKKLLAQAGYADGFDVTVSALGLARTVAEAVIGQLRKVGINARLNALNFGAYRKQQRDGKFQVLVSAWSSGGLPDTSSTANMIFAPGPRNYNGDKMLNKFRIKAAAEMDEGKRRAIYKQAFDRVNEQAYVMPLTTLPTVFVHTKDLAIQNGSLSPYGAALSHIRWK